MKPSIELSPERKLIGMHLPMSLADNKTHQLWRTFMPRRNEIQYNLGTDLISMQVYHNPLDLQHFDPDTTFEKWAAIEVLNFDFVPPGMETFVLQGGMYAVFLHQGAASEGPKTFQFIFGTWLPNSAFELDHRPQFEILGEKYKNDDPLSEEEIWIPIKPKQ